MKSISNIILAILISFSCLNAQDSTEDFVFDPNIKTVNLHLSGYPLSLPLVSLLSNEQLILSFDDLSSGFTNFSYEIIHCKPDWTISTLSPMEYIDGYLNGDIKKYEYSSGVFTDYTHYWLKFPNNDIRPNISGNFLINVYNEDVDGDKELVITRRFMIYENLVDIFPEIKRTASPSINRTHQEIDFKVFANHIKIENPKVTLMATILQNGRWDSAIENVRPLFVYKEELSFDYQNRIVFEGKKDFRYLDIRSMKKNLGNVAVIEPQTEGYDIYLYTDKVLGDHEFISRIDLNGNFFITNWDNKGNNFFEKLSQNGNYNQVHSTFTSGITCDYAMVFASLAVRKPFENYDVHLLGGFNFWKPNEDNKMTYIEEENIYSLSIPLKQGYYDYEYALVPKNGKDKRPQTKITEGNSYQTNNNYTILTYYKPFGAKASRLIGAITFDSTF